MSEHTSTVDVGRTGARAITSNTRGDRTRDRLLDAVEAIAADEGIGALSHRVVARRALLNTGLIHYHFGTIERVLEEALARRAARLTRMQLSGLAALLARQRWSIEEVVAALWQPFASLGGALDGGWRNYLCLVVRLAGDARGDELLARHFDDVTRAAQHALRMLVPGVEDDKLRAGLRYVRILFEKEALARCRKSCPADERAKLDGQLVAFAAAGLRELIGPVNAPVPMRASAG